MADVLVLGSGIAGLSAAIHAARLGRSRHGAHEGRSRASATRYAQGGVAAALEAPDSVELHLSDTLAAGAGLCDPEAVRVLVSEGPARVRELMALGAEFDRTGDGAAAALALAREGGHSVARVVHAGGDATGVEIERALVETVCALDLIEVRERCFTVDLIVESGRCVGVRALDEGGRAIDLRARDTVLATGGAGQLFAVTTNPVVSTGDGIAMALARRRGRRRRRVHAVSPDRAAPSGDAAAAALGSAPWRWRGAPRRARSSRSWPTSTRSPISRRATWSRARSRAGWSIVGSITSGSTPPRSPTSRAGSRRSADRRARSASTRATTGCRSRPLRTTSRVVSAPTSTARPRCRGSGPAVRPRAPACTARIGSRATRCSTGSCSHRASSRRSRREGSRRRDRRPAGRCSRGAACRCLPCVGETDLARVQQTMTNGAGVLRDAASLEGVLAALPRRGGRCRPCVTRAGEPGGGRSGARRVRADPRGVTRHAHASRLPRAVERLPRPVLPRRIRFRVRPAPHRREGDHHMIGAL